MDTCCTPEEIHTTSENNNNNDDSSDTNKNTEGMVHPMPVAEFEEIDDNVEHGEIIGNCKWFSKKLGYGFITCYTGSQRGTNIFVHHSGIRPLNSNFRTLRKGEYVHFNIVDGHNGMQATDVTGVCGGPLMCDNIETRKQMRSRSDNVETSSY